MQSDWTSQSKLHYIKQLILQGEGQHLDFKYNISSARKIAKTFVAFANSNGGTLLIGVKDTGKVTGVRTDEEIYMLESAAQMYCRPEVKFEMKEWEVDGKFVLEVIVPESTTKPHYAEDDNKEWLVYVRVADQNLLANKVLIEVLKRKSTKQSTIIKYNTLEKLLLEYLEKNPSITFSQFQKMAKIPRWKAEKILINLASVDIIKIHVEPQNSYFSLA